MKSKIKKNEIVNEFNFDSCKHEYTINGNPVAHLTGLCSKYLGINFEDIPERNLENARVRGGATHGSLSSYFKGNGFIENRHSGMNHYKEFIQKTFGKINPKDWIVEQSFYSVENQYACTPDLYNKKTYTLYEIKTTAKFEKAYNLLQMAGQAAMLKEHKLPVKKAFVIWINKETAELVQMDLKLSTSVFNNIILKEKIERILYQKIESFIELSKKKEFTIKK